MNKVEKIKKLNEAMFIHLCEVVTNSITDDMFLEYLGYADSGRMMMYFEDNFAVNHNESLTLCDKFLNDPKYIVRMCKDKVEEEVIQNYLRILNSGRR